MARYAIIGDGGAGTTAAYYVRETDPAAQIEIYSDDPNAAYYRAALTNYLMGELREAQLFAVPPDFYQTQNVKRILGRAASVDSNNSVFTLEDGTQVAYDQLLIASGASPNPPNFKGAELPGVMTMRTLQDARRVMDLIAAHRLRRALVIGGGPLGIEWVQGLLHHGVQVTYLLRGDVFFEKALDRTASDLVISRLRAEGVDVHLNEEVGEALSGRDGRLRAVRLMSSGHEIECQLVGAAIGIRPNIDFLAGSGIDIAVDPKRGTPQGINVDASMRTNIPNVYAAGDVIHRALGLWEPARLQGRVAGRNMAGGSESFRPGVHYNATRLYDLDFAGVGEFFDKPGDQVLIDIPRGSGRLAYRKLIVREGKLVGAIMLGQRKEHVRKYGMQYRNLIDQGIDISTVANDLLDPFFDLASWLDSRKIGDQIDSARQIRVAPKSPSIADIRRTRHELKVKSPELSKTMSEMAEATLLHANTRIPLKKVTLIGRASENDLILNDANVSGQHARVHWEETTFLLEDLQSTNGTFLNGQRISSPTQLDNGALIKLGGTQIQFFTGTSTHAKNLRMTSAGLPEAPLAPSALPSDPVWGILQVGGREIPLRMLAINIGRDTKADISLDDPTISYIHAQLVRQENETYLRDLGSRNGTFVNRTRISMPHRLELGDEVRLGETTLIFGSSTSSAARVVVTASAPTESLVTEETNVKEQPLEPIPVPPRASAMILTLTVRSGELTGRAFPLNQSPMTLGRDPASQIAIPHATVSWNHAAFKQEDMNWFVKDLGSRNGTQLNGTRLQANEPYPLHLGDQLKFGDMLLEVTPDAN